MKKLFLTPVFAILSLHSFTQDIYAESSHSGFKADLSDQENGTITKMYFHFDEMYIDYLVKDFNEDLEIDIRLLITDMRKSATRDFKTSYKFRVAFFDGEDMGDLELTLIEDGDNLFVARLLDRYIIGRYIKN